MSSIVKAAAVVDDRGRQKGPVITGLFDQPHHVIKRQILSGGFSVNQEQFASGGLDYTEQLNRIRIQVNEAKEELRSITGSLADARDQVERLRKEQEMLESVRETGVDEKIRQMLEDAEKQAQFLKDRMLRESEEASAQMRSQGYAEGLDQGRNEALDTFREEHRADIEKLSALMDGVDGIFREQVESSERQIVSLVCAVSEKVIGRALREKPETIVDMLREVLEENRREAFIKVTIAADLLPAQATVSKNILERIQQMGDQIDVRVESVGEPGSLIVETPKGFADLSVETQMMNMEATLQETLGEAEE